MPATVDNHPCPGNIRPENTRDVCARLSALASDHDGVVVAGGATVTYMDVIAAGRYVRGGERADRNVADPGGVVLQGVGADGRVGAPGGICNQRVVTDGRVIGRGGGIPRRVIADGSIIEPLRRCKKLQGL